MLKVGSASVGDGRLMFNCSGVLLCRADLGRGRRITVVVSCLGVFGRQVGEFDALLIALVHGVR